MESEAHLGSEGYDWNTRVWADGVSSQSVLEFEPGKYEFEFDWSTSGEAMQSCSLAKFTAGEHSLGNAVPDFGWTSVSSSTHKRIWI